MTKYVCYNKVNEVPSSVAILQVLTILLSSVSRCENTVVTTVSVMFVMEIRHRDLGQAVGTRQHEFSLN